MVGHGNKNKRAQKRDREGGLRGENDYFLNVHSAFKGFRRIVFLSPTLHMDLNRVTRVGGGEETGTSIHFGLKSLPTWNPNLKDLPFVKCSDTS